MAKNTTLPAAILLLIMLFAFAHITASAGTISEITSEIKKIKQIHSEKYNFNEYFVAASPVVKTKSGYKHKETVATAGGVERAVYTAEGTSEDADLFSQLSKKLSELGFSKIFSCSGDKCGRRWQKTTYFLNELNVSSTGGVAIPLVSGNDEQKYISAVRQASGKKTYATIYYVKGWWKYPAFIVDVIKEKELDNNLIKIVPEKFDDTVKAETINVRSQ